MANLKGLYARGVGFVIGLKGLFARGFSNPPVSHGSRIVIRKSVEEPPTSPNGIKGFFLRGLGTLTGTSGFFLRGVGGTSGTPVPASRVMIISTDSTKNKITIRETNDLP